MSLELIELIIGLFFIVIVVVPVTFNISKNTMYDEWKRIWKSEVEAETRKLAMLSVNQNKDKLAKKTKRI